jgi:DNA-binding MarR family transcriptional regulator
MNGLELLVLGRTLMKIGGAALTTTPGDNLPASVRSVLLDIVQHPGTSVSQITERTGFPQSHVSASIVRLRDAGALTSMTDPKDRRRTLLRASSTAPGQLLVVSTAPVDAAVAAALGTDDPAEIAEVVKMLDTLAARLTANQR